MHIFVLKLCWNKGSNVVENKLEPHKEREREGKRISQVSAPEGQVCPEVLLSPKEHEPKWSPVLPWRVQSSRGTERQSVHCIHELLSEAVNHGFAVRIFASQFRSAWMKIMNW